MPTYAQERSGMLYYQVLQQMIETLVEPGDVLIDVGNGGTDVVTYGEFTHRIAIDLSPLPERKGVRNYMCDWMKFPPSKAKLVTCCQVIEHIQDPIPFVQKLFNTGDFILISVPYKWSKGACKGHIHDPIDEEKLEKWTGRPPSISTIVREPEGPRRYIALYRNTL